MNIILVFSTIVAEKLVIAESKKRFRLGKCKNLCHRENIVEVNMRDRVSTLKIVRALDVNVVSPLKRRIRIIQLASTIKDCPRMWQ